MQFNDIIGQLRVKEQLVNMVHQNRLSHALLFLGKEGSGSLSLALAFTQYVVCTSANPDNGNDSSLFQGVAPAGSHDRGRDSDAADSCGTCLACKKAHKLIHPDIHFTFPVITKKTGEA